MTLVDLTALLQQLGPREGMDCDVAIVAAGPADLSAAILLKQLAAGFSAKNCIHCYTRDFKASTKNLTWISQEGSGGTNYAGMCA